MTEMDFEATVRTIATRIEYPLTPNIAGRVAARLRSSTRPRFVSKAVAWSLTILLVLVSSLMLIPPARAAILEFIQIGVVRIFRSEPTPLPAPTAISTVNKVPVTATPVPTQLPLIPILRELAGETTLEEAQKKVSYPLLLPSYPPDLGRPDYVFVQNQDGEMTVLVWVDPQDPDKILMSLHFLPPGSWGIKKMEPKVIQETTVNKKRAIWTTGPYIMKFNNGDTQYVRLIDGNVLIWTEGAITYRLETDVSLDEAIKIAESLKSITAP
jgi:hypothetical protein